ncbi:MAG: hypothetical protein M1457_00240 [bacterium]|nr:hypothetical protein [bacterium]
MNERATGTNENANPPEIWMSMRHGVPDLAAPGARWDFVKRNLGGFKFMRSNLGAFATLDQDKEVIAIMNEHHIPMHIEVAGAMPHGPVGENLGRVAGDFDMRHCVDPLSQRGAKIQILDVDWQVHQLRAEMAKKWPGETTQQLMERAAGFFVDYMRTINEKYPDIRFFLLSNFPNWRWKGGPNNAADWGDYWDVVSAVVPRARAAKAPLIGITVDYPYNYAIRKGPVDWVARVREMEDYARSQGLQFNLIINCQDGGNTSDQAFYENTLKYLDLYRKAGGHPDRYIVQSWYDYPKAIVPEDKPYSMTNLVMDVIKRTRGE